jgi:hypothetical protein
VTEPTPGLRQTLTWKGGFWLALVIPMSGLTLVEAAAARSGS